MSTTSPPPPRTHDARGSRSGRVVLMCGPSGAGKSTYARALERAGWTRLSIDVSAWARGYRHWPVPVEVARSVDAVHRARLHDLVEAGRDVVLDYAFATRAVREEYRALAAAAGTEAETWYVATPREVALARVRARAGRGPDEAVLTEERAAAHVDEFEVPTDAEPRVRVVRGAGPVVLPN
ncbi:Predicted kinase [Paraoerskovia marina]|uniref:Predicted kinase n=1 Tax=Paraoerskovia marina TaxID=545619 RepID=A0A1H1MY70_9CELL|nr:ATP-binding protein [Paraoerskovia marina]SDR90869.1 Predicted kinase [Paraoerskovia marina]